jgi:hypothetical protein
LGEETSGWMDLEQLDIEKLAEAFWKLLWKNTEMIEMIEEAILENMNIL